MIAGMNIKPIQKIALVLLFSLQEQRLNIKIVDFLFLIAKRLECLKYTL